MNPSQLPNRIEAGHGIAPLVFGMLPSDVEALWGPPQRQHTDEDDNLLWDYDAPALRLTFYQEEAGRLGYLESLQRGLTWKGISLIGAPAPAVLEQLKALGIRDWECQIGPDGNRFGSSWFSESHWVMLHEEMGHIQRVEWGVLIKNLDEFDWKYPVKK